MNNIDRFLTTIKSNVINSVEWTPDNNDRGTLCVNFKNNTSYEYYDVPSETFTNFLNAESKGKEFAASIKNKFTSKKLIIPEKALT